MFFFLRFCEFIFFQKNKNLFCTYRNIMFFFVCIVFENLCIKFEKKQHFLMVFHFEWLQYALQLQPYVMKVLRPCLQPSNSLILQKSHKLSVLRAILFFVSFKHSRLDFFTNSGKATQTSQFWMIHKYNPNKFQSFRGCPLTLINHSFCWICLCIGCKKKTQKQNHLKRNG